MSSEILHLATTLGQLLEIAGRKVVVAESCTGGAVGAAITAVPGSSRWFDGGFITYNNQAKMRWLNVEEELLLQHGAVSDEVVSAMAAGALEQSGADYTVAVSGIAGPDGGTAGKPVGTVWCAWAGSPGEAVQRCFHFSGDRETVRQKAVVQALQGLVVMVQGHLDAQAV